MNHDQIIEAVARAMCDDEFISGTWDVSPIWQFRFINLATAARDGDHWHAADAKAKAAESRQKARLIEAEEPTNAG
jgi:hypothetical protein